MVSNSIVEVVLPEEAVHGKTLGRHVQHDPRSRDFPAVQAEHLVSVKHRTSGLPLDQEAHRCSTAHALCGALGASTASETHVSTTTAVQIYEQAKRLEDGRGSLAGEDGSSGLMACKAAKSLGLISAYEHAFGIEHALRALVLRPVITGFKWYSSFDHPDPETGVVDIAPNATVRGGHEVTADEIDTEAELVWFCNSWGRDFGIEGRFCMTFETWARLLTDQGDVALPVP